ncbi:MAG: DUF3048 domain-containing protein [Clostridia bacterium]|nr:DUF3048 domain-containing protein [Clostridia bacterium]
MKKIVCIVLATLMALACAATAEGANLSITTGLPTDKPAHIMVVQMDNEPKARPQKGIASADVVYEIELYNGGYTRYTAVFNDTIPEQVEAVRSARIVNVDVYSEYGGALVHYGARVDPDSNMYDYFNANGFTAELDGNNHNPVKTYPSAGNLFYRDSSRAAPNNVVAKFTDLYNLVDWSTVSCRSPLKFNEFPTIPSGEDVTNFQIPYRDSYTPSYQWDAAAGKYLRFYNGKPYNDGATGEQVTCDNVIVQHVEYAWFGGKAEAPKVTLFGTNSCDYFIGGKHITGYWVRDSIANTTTYYDAAGNEILLNPGHTYIEILKTEKSLEILG